MQEFNLVASPRMYETPLVDIRIEVAEHTQMNFQLTVAQARDIVIEIQTSLKHIEKLTCTS